MMRVGTVLSAAAVSLLVLSGCSEERPVVDGQPEPPAATEEDSANDTGEATAGDAVEKLREAAKSAIEGAGELAQSAREAADEALKDAGPALEKAGEIAGQFKASVDEIIAKAASDLERATKALEEQIAGSPQPPAKAPGDQAAVLAPAESLNADTRAAARAGPAGVGPDYVGVWAADAASCAKIDQEPLEIFAVITPTTIRRHESVCNIEPAPLAEGEVTLDATCIAEGITEERRISLAMASLDTLRIEYEGSPGGADLVRCHLPR